MLNEVCNVDADDAQEPFEIEDMQPKPIIVDGYET
jgi:hypothetical protein